MPLRENQWIPNGRCPSRVPICGFDRAPWNDAVRANQEILQQARKGYESALAETQG